MAAVIAVIIMLAIAGFFLRGFFAIALFGLKFIFDVVTFPIVIVSCAAVSGMSDLPQTHAAQHALTGSYTFHYKNLAVTCGTVLRAVCNGKFLFNYF